MKLIAGVAVAVLGMAFSISAKADEFQANATCKTLTGTAGIHDTGYASSGSTNAEILCGLKRVICASGGCSYSATVWLLDGNSNTDADSSIKCRLKLQAKQTQGTNVMGTEVSTGSGTRNLETMSLSITLPNPVDGMMSLYCRMAKDDPSDGGHSYVTWIGNTTF